MKYFVFCSFSYFSSMRAHKTLVFLVFFSSIRKKIFLRKSTVFCDTAFILEHTLKKLNRINGNGMKVFNSMEELVGNTPLLRLKNVEKEYSLKARLFAKLEGVNPSNVAT